LAVAHTQRFTRERAIKDAESVEASIAAAGVKHFVFFIEDGRGKVRAHGFTSPQQVAVLAEILAGEMKTKRQQNGGDSKSPVTVHVTVNALRERGQLARIFPEVSKTLQVLSLVNTGAAGKLRGEPVISDE
jgi:hypothetical protein